MCKRELAEAIARNLPGHLIDLLRVCVECQSKAPGGPVGGKWFKYACEQQGVAFHPSWLTKLADNKLLTKCEGGRGGHRRDYRIADDELARLVLMFWAGE